MKKTFLLLLVMGSVYTLSAQDVYLDKAATISFNASTPLEDIDAKSEKGVGALNLKDKTVYWSVQMTSFVFRRELMQEHFNENYMESEKYPTGTFKGKINEDVDLTQNGTYKVTVTGDFTVHGVTKKRTIDGTITMKDKTIEINSSFDVQVADHNIKIPSVVGQKIAESVKVTIHAMLLPSQK